MKIYRYLTATVAVVAALTIAAQARADTINFFLTTPETGSAPTHPVEVTVTTGSFAGGVITGAFTAGGTSPFTGAQVTFTNPGTGNMAPVELNIHGAFEALSTAGLAASSPCVGNGGSIGTVSTCVGGGSGAGTFGTMSIETGNPTATSIVIDLLALGSNNWANAAAVVTPDSKGFEALAAFQNGGVQDGGFYTATPLPAALPLFATGIGGLGFLGWRRKRKAQAVA
jgi:hypothetical protein